MTRTAAAPSEICEDEPAVTVPSSENAGARPASFSMLVSRRTPSSKVEDLGTVGAGRCQHDQLVLESAFVLGGGGPSVGLQGEGVHLVSPDVPAGWAMASAESPWWMKS